MLNLTSEQLKKYSELLIKTTNHSSVQIRTFFNVLHGRMSELHIISLEDLLVRYESIDKCLSSEKNEFLREIVGLFHYPILKLLLDVMVKEKQSLKMVKRLSEEIQSEEELQKSLDMSSQEYKDSLDKQKYLLDRKLYYLSNLIN